MHRDISEVTVLEERPEGMVLVAYVLDRTYRLSSTDDSAKLLPHATHSRILHITPWDKTVIVKGYQHDEVRLHRHGTAQGEPVPPWN